jgi:adenine deaminase
MDRMVERLGLPIGEPDLEVTGEDAAPGKVVATLPLPLFGLLPPQLLETVAPSIEAVEAAARELGLTLPTPLATLSFLALALPVIPELHFATHGLAEGYTGKLKGAR